MVTAGRAIGIIPWTDVCVCVKLASAMQSIKCFRPIRLGKTRGLRRPDAQFKKVSNLKRVNSLAVPASPLHTIKKIDRGRPYR
jgi:hypothetical protein